MGVKKNPKSSLVIPSQMQIGFEANAEAEPVIAKTMKMILSWKLDCIPQRFFNFSIIDSETYKCSNYYLGGTCPYNICL